MAKFVSFGYYNGVDAVMMSDYSADKVVDNMKRGIGDFRHYDSGSECEETDGYLMVNHYAKATEDGEYIVVFDVADRFNDCPLDLLADNVRDEFIDIWKKVA